MRNKIFFLAMAIILVLLGNYSSTEASKNVSYNSIEDIYNSYSSIEELVRASGGTYGVIDTSDPDAANNFVQTVFDQGLTSSDGNGNCWSMTIRPSIKISCALSVNKDAYYYYEGKKGEKVVITVSAKNFVPEISISDANSEMEFFDNKQKQNYIVVEKTLPHDGGYSFKVRARYNTEVKEGEIFTIHMTSDKSNIQPDVRKDLLIEGNKYSIRELNLNQSTTSRKFFVDAYVAYIYKAPLCPRNAISCPITLPPNITITDGDCTVAGPVSACVNDENSTSLKLGSYKDYDFKVDWKYRFEVCVTNTSKTNVPSNNFFLVSVKEFVESDFSGGLEKGQFYTVSELTNKRNQINEITINTEGYVVGKKQCSNSDKIGCGPDGMLTVSEDETQENKEIINIIQDYKNKVDITRIGIGKKYKFTIKTGGNIGGSIVLVSFEEKKEDPEGDTIFVDDNTVGNDNQKMSSLSSFWKWLNNLFK